MKYLLTLVNHSPHSVMISRNPFSGSKGLGNFLQPHYNSKYCVFPKTCPVQRVQSVHCWLRMQLHSISAHAGPVRGTSIPSSQLSFKGTTITGPIRRNRPNGELILRHG